MSQATQGFSALAEMMSNIGPIAVGVLALLLVSSIYSWTVIFGKWSTFRKATAQSKKFIRAFRKATRLQEIAALTSDCGGSPLAQVFEDVYDTYKRVTGGSGPPRSLAPQIAPTLGLASAVADAVVDHGLRYQLAPRQRGAEGVSVQVAR